LNQLQLPLKRRTFIGTSAAASVGCGLAKMECNESNKEKVHSTNHYSQALLLVLVAIPRGDFLKSLNAWELQSIDLIGLKTGLLT